SIVFDGANFVKHEEFDPVHVQVDNNTSDIASLKTKVDTNTGNITSLNTSVVNLSSQVDTNTSDIAELKKGNNSELAEKVESNANRIGNLETNYVATQTVIESLE